MYAPNQLVEGDVAVQLPERRLWFDPGLMLSAALTLPTFLPMLQEGLFATHDGLEHVVQVFEMGRSISTGPFYPRWAPDFALGYGMPLYDFYPPLSHYVALLFGFLGPTSAMKFTFALSFVLSAVAMYLFVKDLWGTHAGVLAAAVYTYFPYHPEDVFVRGAVAEAWSFVFFPLLLWALYRINKNLSPGNVALGALAFSGLLLSHHGMALVFAPVAAAYALLLLLEKRYQSPKEFIAKALPFTFPILLGLGLSAFFLMPYLAEIKYVQLDRLNSNFSPYDHFVYFFQLFSSFWGHGLSVKGPNDGMSFQLGLVPLSLTAVGLLAEFVIGSKEKPRAQLLFFLAIVLIATFMTLDISQPIWGAIPFLTPLQFPWRFLEIAGFGMSIIAGSLVIHDRFSQQTLTYLTGVLVLVIIVFSYRFLDTDNNRMYDNQIGLPLIANIEANYGKFGMTVAGEYLPIWAEAPTTSPMLQGLLRGASLQKVRSVSPSGANANLLVHTADSDEFRVNFPSDGRLEVNTFYFPGWKAEIDGKPYDITPSEFLTINVPAGNHLVKVFFGDTPIRTFANIFSVLSLLGLVFLLIPGRYRTVFRVGRPGAPKSSPHIP